MNDFVYRKIWLPIDVNGDDLVKTIQGSAPLMYKGGETMLCIALFNSMPNSSSNGEFLNHALLASFFVKIRTGSHAGTAILDSTAGGDTEIDPTVTEAQFAARTKAPIQIYLPTLITAITAGSQYIQFIGATTDKPAQPDGFGRGLITVEDIGIGAADSVAPAADGAASMSVVNAALAQCVKYGKNPRGKTVTFVSPNAGKGRTIGCDDAGKQISNLETY